MLRMDEDGAEPEIFVGDEFNAEGATFSPDGRYVAYSAEEAGQREVYIRAYPRSGGRTTVSVGGGREVTWGRNGELFYRTLTGQGMAIKIATQPGLSVGDPVELSGGRYFSRYGGAPRASYDVTSDGRRFLALLEVGDRSDDATQPRLVVVQNWLSELRRLVPAD
jgi:eukaryotic-like serine/threonine-protein kinase